MDRAVAIRFALAAAVGVLVLAVATSAHLRAVAVAGETGVAPADRLRGLSRVWRRVGFASWAGLLVAGGAALVLDFAGPLPWFPIPVFDLVAAALALFFVPGWICIHSVTEAEARVRPEGWARRAVLSQRRLNAVGFSGIVILHVLVVAGVGAVAAGSPSRVVLVPFFTGLAASCWRGCMRRTCVGRLDLDAADLESRLAARFANDASFPVCRVRIDGIGLYGVWDAGTAASPAVTVTDDIERAVRPAELDAILVASVLRQWWRRTDFLWSVWSWGVPAVLAVLDVLTPASALAAFVAGLWLYPWIRAREERRILRRRMDAGDRLLLAVAVLRLSAALQAVPLGDAARVPADATWCRSIGVDPEEVLRVAEAATSPPA